MAACCQEIGLQASTYWRWTRCGEVADDQRPLASRPTPAHKLTEEEQQAIVAICCSEEYADLPPSQIVPKLLDQRMYLGSESSYYRVLRAHNLQHARTRKAANNKPAKPELQASEPNQIWCWDVSLLKSLVLGQFFYLHLFLDLYSRKIVMADVYETENGEIAAELTQKALLREGIHQAPPKVLHSDNGGPMRSATLRATLQQLGIAQSFSRPSTSNDNAYVESFFGTMKQAPSYPVKGFKTLEEAREWVAKFVRWYNEAHQHRGLNYVTPNQRHAGEDTAILANRKQVLIAAKGKHPARWWGEVRNCEPVGVVYINKPEIELENAA